MESCITIHGRAMERHPEITPEDVAHAWASRVATATRCGKYSDELVVIGFDANGRMIEIVAVEQADDTILVFHCMAPPSAKTLRETHLID